MKALASTFHPITGDTVEVEVLSVPSDTGLVKVSLDGKALVRHVDRLSPSNDLAWEMLRK